jgi:antitoxin component YwqK of YwqJK toxin-antitoxin module
MRSLGKNRKDRNGLKQGLWEEYWDNGNLQSKGSYVNGLKEGYWEYYEDGNLISKGLYKEGNKEGIWEYYNKDGSLDCKILYGIMVI